MKKTFYLLALIGLVAFAACGRKGDKAPEEKDNPQDIRLKGDRTVYGLACDGCNDSAVWLLPADNSDPVKYDIIDAHRNHKIVGKLKIGDRIGIVPSKDDAKVADFVIDLDQLQGSWCYIVMPQFRDYDKLSKKQQARIERNMPDSVKEQFLIPREYGFTLKRQYQAQSIGYVRQASTLEDESPVVYPKMAYYFEWHILNGQLILYRYASDPPRSTGNKDGKSKVKMPEIIQDTIDVAFLSDDSLVLSSDGVTRSYYRISKASDANKLAREKAEQSAKAALKNITSGSNDESEKEVKAAEAKLKKK